MWRTSTRNSYDEEEEDTGGEMEVNQHQGKKEKLCYCQCPYDDISEMIG